MSSVSETRKTEGLAHWWEVAGKTLLAGGCGGVASRTLVAPLERIKIIFQTQGQPPVYTGVVQALQKIIREEGVRGYFKGNGVNCIRIFPTSALQFYCYETYKRMLLDHPYFHNQADLTPLQRLIPGSMAGITALVATYPLEFVRCRLTLQKTKIYNGIWDCMVKVARQEGVFALYRGLWPSILGVVPYVGIDFAAYETLKDFCPRRPDGTIAPYVTLACGGCAGLVAQTASYPLDLIRRRLQVQGFSSDIALSDGHYKGVVDAFIRIYRTEGILGFYRGLVPNCIKVAPAIAVSFYVYELMKQVLKIPQRVPNRPPQPAPATQPAPEPIASTSTATTSATTEEDAV